MTPPSEPSGASAISLAVSRVESVLGVRHPAEFVDALRDLLPVIPREKWQALADEVLASHKTAGKTVPQEWIGASSRLAIGSRPGRAAGCSSCCEGSRFYLVWLLVGIEVRSYTTWFSYARPEGERVKPIALAADCTCPAGRALTEKARRREHLPCSMAAVIVRSRGALTEGDFFDGTTRGALKLTTPRSAELVRAWTEETDPAEHPRPTVEEEA